MDLFKNGSHGQPSLDPWQPGVIPDPLKHCQVWPRNKDQSSPWAEETAQACAQPHGATPTPAAKNGREALRPRNPLPALLRVDSEKRKQGLLGRRVKAPNLRAAEPNVATATAQFLEPCPDQTPRARHSPREQPGVVQSGGRGGSQLFPLTANAAPERRSTLRLTAWAEQTHVPGSVPGDRGADSLGQGAGRGGLEKLVFRGGHRPQQTHFNRNQDIEKLGWGRKHRVPDRPPICSGI